MTTERNVKGLLGTKLGMTQLWDENNRVVPVTVIAASTNVVICKSMSKAYALKSRTWKSKI